MKLPARLWIAIDERNNEAIMATLSQTRDMAIGKANALGNEDWGLVFHVQEVLIFSIHADTKKQLLSQELS